MKLLFGNEETLSIIGKALSSGRDEDYKPLCDILYNDINFWVNKYCHGVQSVDKEDIVEDVIVNVLRNLPRFYNSPKSKSGLSRGSYLKTITYNKCMDFFRKAKSDALNGTVGLDDNNIQPKKEGFSRCLEDREEFYEALKRVFECNTTPDKLLAFVFKRLLWSSGGSNGSPKEIREEFDGKPVIYLYELMISGFKTILDEEIPPTVLTPLMEKINADPYMVFNMSEHMIADDKWIIKKLKEKTINE